MKNNKVLILAVAFMAMTAVSAFAYETTSTTTTTRDENGIITSVHYKDSTPWFTVRNADGVENKVYIDNNNSRGWTRVPEWDSHFIAGTPVRYEYENRNNSWYARNVYIADNANDQPAGWSQGKKVGWNGSDTPPGRGRGNDK